MKLELKRFDNSISKEWDEFVENDSMNGTFLHTRKFYNHNPLNKLDDNSYLFYKKNKIAAVIPFSLYEKEGKKFLHSHPRATYGGFVINNAIKLEESIEMLYSLILEAKSKNVHEIIIRNPFRIFYSQLSDETDYAMWYHNFLLKSRELEIYIALTGDIEMIRSKYENGTKYNIKKAKKFIEVKEQTQYADFWEILNKNLAVKYGKKPVHSIEEFVTLVNNFGNDKIKFFGGFINGKLVCGCVIFIHDKRVIHAQYIAQDEQYQEYRPLNAVIDFIIHWGNINNIRYFNLGTANEGDGRIINSGLFHFKESFGGKGVLRETMHLNLS